MPLVTGLGAPDEITYRCSFAEGYEPVARARAPRRSAAPREEAAPPPP